MTERIKENRDFRRIYSRGKSFVSSSAVAYVSPNRRNVTRLGVTCSKKIGSAVVRNRAKRVLRAAFAAIEDRVTPGYDIILVARSSTAERKSTKVSVSLTELFSQAGIMK